MNIKDKIKQTISEIENNIIEIRKELRDPKVKNRPGKFQSIKYAEKMILDFKKELEEMKDEK